MNKEKSRWSRLYEAFEERSSGLLLFTGLTLIGPLILFGVWPDVSTWLPSRMR
jgi:hypothetical protein